MWKWLWLRQRVQILLLWRQWAAAEYPLWKSGGSPAIIFCFLPICLLHITLQLLRFQTRRIIWLKQTVALSVLTVSFDDRLLFSAETVIRVGLLFGLSHFISSISLWPASSAALVIRALAVLKAVMKMPLLPLFMIIINFLLCSCR